MIINPIIKILFKKFRKTALKLPFLGLMATFVEINFFTFFNSFLMHFNTIQKCYIFNFQMNFRTGRKLASIPSKSQLINWASEGVGIVETRFKSLWVILHSFKCPALSIYDTLFFLYIPFIRLWTRCRMMRVYCQLFY